MKLIRYISYYKLSSSLSYWSYRGSRVYYFKSKVILAHPTDWYKGGENNKMSKIKDNLMDFDDSGYFPQIFQIDTKIEYLPKNWANNLINKIIWGNNKHYYK